MKIIILGLPKSGRSTVAKELANKSELHYLHAENWINASFRQRVTSETLEEYKLSLHNFYAERLKINPNIISNNIKETIKARNTVKVSDAVIDGLNSPRDFIHLFDYNQDLVIFLNRTNGPNYIEGCDHINVNVVRDYCLWLGTMGLLPKQNWLEFNFPIPGNLKDPFTKELGNKNTVIITRSIEKTIEMIKENYDTRIGQKV